MDAPAPTSAPTPPDAETAAERPRITVPMVVTTPIPLREPTKPNDSSDDSVED